MMQGYLKNLDEFVGKTTGNVLPTEQALLDARRQINPQQQQLDYDLASEFLPQFTELGLQQQRQQQEGTAANDATLLRGTGKDLVAANLEAQKIADPEYYKTRTGTADQIARLFGSLDDPDGGLSPTEQAEIDRSIARTNVQRGIEAPTATSAVQAGMEFGKAGQDRKMQKQQAINAAVQTAGATMPALKSGVDVLQLTTGRPSQVNQGLGRYGDNAAIGQTSMGLGQQLMGQVGDNARQTADINSKKRTAFDTVLGGFNMAESI